MFKAGRMAVVAAKQRATMKLGPLGKYLRCIAGGTAVTFAVSAPAVLGGGGRSHGLRHFFHEEKHAPGRRRCGRPGCNP